MKIRRFQPSDSKEVIDLITSVMRTEFPDDQKVFPVDDLKEITHHYGNKGEQFFVAVEDDKIVGTVGVKREDERSALLRRIFVKPEFRGRGIGSGLVMQAISFCRENGYELIVFKSTSRMQRAIQLCQRSGFSEKAKVDLGGIELFKFSYSIPNHTKSPSS